MGENAGQRPAVRVVVIKGFLSRSRDGGAAVVGRDRPGWGESRALGVIELVNVHLPTVPNVGARSTTGNCGLSPMTPILFFHPFQILSVLRSHPSLRGYVRCLDSSSVVVARRGRFSRAGLVLRACARRGDLPSRAEL